MITGTYKFFKAVLSIVVHKNKGGERASTPLAHPPPPGCADEDVNRKQKSHGVEEPLPKNLLIFK